jgi:hypothetical protein
MKIEELEKLLKDMKKLHGNIEVKVGLSEENLENSVRFADRRIELKFDDVDFFEDIDGKVIRILA